MANENSWTPPVEFYFRVDFQRQSTHFQVSFLEVSGLSQTIQTSERKNDDYTRTKIPESITNGNITLKCPIYPLADSFSKWIDSCFAYADKGTMEAYDMVIKLLDKNGKPSAGWLCSHAYPIKWSLGTLNGAHSGLALETVEMTCNRLKRIS